MMELQAGTQLLVLVGVLLLALVAACWSYCLPRQGEDEDLQAEKRAAELLQDVLSEEEFQQLADLGYLVVPSPNLSGRSYRVPAQPGWVDVFDANRLAMRLCVEPLERLPASDVVLMHKLMIEGDEDSYLRKANIMDARPPADRRRGRRHVPSC